MVEHYPRLVRIAYLVLPPSLGRNRRVLTAHALVQRSLPRGRTATVDGVLPGPRRADGGGGPGGARNPGYTYVRARVLRQALDAGRPLLRLARPRRAQLPPVLPRVWGLRLFPRSGGADELALDQRLSALSGPARAAFVLRGLEGLADADVERTLGAAGADDPAGALARAVAAETPESGALLRSAEFDPCSLQARPTDLMRRRQHAKAALAATAALLVCAAFLGLPGDGWGPGGAAAPSYARNPMAQAALDPAKVRRVAPAFWEGSARTDFSAWPTRGALAGDTGLLRRALAVWARPGRTVQVSATPGTPSGPPMGSPQLLYAGRVDAVRVVLLYDGLRVVRYAEATDGGGAAGLDFARVDGADGSASGALVLARSDSDVRFLTAPWVTRTSVRDLRDPEAPARPLGRDADGVTDPMDSPATARDCGSWDTLDVRDGSHDRLLTDLGELTPARLTSGPPSSPSDVSSAQDRVVWARTACLLPTVRSHGVRSVNSWAFARQTLPEANGTAEWLCTRAETWRGTGSRVLAQFQPPSATKPAPAGAIAARAEDSPACGAREPRAVLAGVLWKSRGGQWYVLAAGSEEFRSLTVSGGVKGTAKGRMLAVRASAGARAELKGAVEGGGSVGALR
ncbi:hypothetical protein [Streptomyces sp. NPDC006638]|uniref:hypothetical protein n=1 Tax=Streptomyces sp. NPDC006638 TaxID=3157183 RepID=UPI0033BB3196